MTSLNQYIDISSGLIGAPYRLIGVPKYEPSPTRAPSNPHQSACSRSPTLYLLIDMSKADKRSLQSSQKRVKNTIRYHITPAIIKTQTIRGRQAITSTTEKSIKLRLDVINGVRSTQIVKVISVNKCQSYWEFVVFTFSLPPG